MQDGGTITDASRACWSPPRTRTAEVPATDERRTHALGAGDAAKPALRGGSPARARSAGRTLAGALQRPDFRGRGNPSVAARSLN